MTVEQILNLDCRESVSNDIIQKHLKNIKPLSKYGVIETVPIYKIEKVITVLSKKYDMRIRELVSDVWSNDEETIWKAVIINEKNLKTGTIYGITLYEVLAKVAIYMYSIREEVGERQG